MNEFAQPWFSEESAYEAAVVYFLSADDAKEVTASRAVAGDHAGLQMEPHFTLLYLGHMTGANLRVMAEDLGGIGWPSLTVRVNGIGAFYKDERVTNVHLKLEPVADVLQMHRRAYEAASRHPWFSPGSYVDGGYVPHISIVDRVNLAAFDRDDLRLQSWVGRPIALPAPSLVSLRLDPVLLCNLSTASTTGR